MRSTRPFSGLPRPSCARYRFTRPFLLFCQESRHL
ncbi:hypothetical protein J2Z18_006109 [Paenibacillus lactis]|uniref:Uncharacterized protein n=1 Tax=Paenibacillus lactis TaxID=228574 RepID=A0ABS4FL38_9BACL|nr:hypothetical protein [Paenibacillus lactis]